MAPAGAGVVLPGEDRARDRPRAALDRPGGRRLLARALDLRAPATRGGARDRHRPSAALRPRGAQPALPAAGRGFVSPGRRRRGAGSRRRARLRAHEPRPRDRAVRARRGRRRPGADLQRPGRGPGVGAAPEGGGAPNRLRARSRPLVCRRGRDGGDRRHRASGASRAARGLGRGGRERVRDRDRGRCTRVRGLPGSGADRRPARARQRAGGRLPRDRAGGRRPFRDRHGDRVRRRRVPGRRRDGERGSRRAPRRTAWSRPICPRTGSRS